MPDRALERLQPIELRPPVSVVFWGRTLSAIVPIALWFAPLGLAPQAQHAIAIAIGVVIAWITHAYDHALTGLMGCYLFWALKVVK